MSNIRDRRLLASMQELMGSSCMLLILSLIIIILVESNGIECAQVSSNNNQSVTSSSRPYWHKPGCHQVGHTRTISIPGCVKFNLSTNACRGFCMSFSIPATDDIGPAPVAGQLDHLDGLVVTGGGGAGGSTAGMATTPTASTPPVTEAVSGTMDTQQLASIISGQVDGLPQHQQQPLIITRRLAARNARDSAQSNLNQDDGKQQKTSGLQMSEFLHLAGQTKSPLAGAVGDLSDRRDVISVGQCCNMMETEDVTINLRCGLNETRKLVFKSAKTCECFFCKHL